MERTDMMIRTHAMQRQHQHQYLPQDKLFLTGSSSSSSDEQQYFEIHHEPIGELGTLLAFAIAAV